MASAKNFLSQDVVLEEGRLNYIVRHALIEDIGKGDITTQLTVPQDKSIEAAFLAKESFVICGIPVAEKAFKLFDPAVKFTSSVKEGRPVSKGQVLINVSGKARSILTSERVALNLLSMLSGICTKTSEYIKKIKPCTTKITDTRKTIPGLRELQKYAVRIGGGHSHRMGLDEMILIKDNHIKVTDGYDKLPSVPPGFKIEIEVQNIDEFKHALRFKPDVIMLDNMKVDDIKKAVKIRNNTKFDSHHPPTKLEVSGGVNLKTVKRIASSGVDIISIGDLTHSLDSVDISLEVL